MITTSRQADYPIEPVFLHRHSPYEFNGETVEEEKLLTILEAARFAPSSYNNQPWHLAYATRADKEWNRFFDFLLPGNQEWCGRAAVLCVILSTEEVKRNQETQSQPTHSLDTGIFIQNLLLQAHLLEVAAHPMAGFKKETVRATFGLPTYWHPQCMVALGKFTKQAPEASNRYALAKITSRGIPEQSALTK